MDISETPQPNQSLARLTAASSGLRLPPPPPMARPSSGNTAFSPRVVLRGILRHWWQALTLWVVGTAALGAIVYTKFKPEYQSVGVLRVEPPTADLFNSLRTTDDSYMSTQVALIESPSVLSAAAQRVGGLACLKEADDTETELKSMLLVGIVPKSYLIQVAVTAPSPDEAAQITEAVVEAYLESNEEWAEAASKMQLDVLEDKQTELKQAMKASESKLLSLAATNDLAPTLISSVRPRGESGDGSKDTGTAGPEKSQYEVDVEQYGRLQSEMLHQEVDLAAAKAMYELRRREVEAMTADPRHASEKQIQIQVERLFKADPEVAPLIAEIRSTQEQMGTMDRRIRRNNDPTLLGLQAKLSQLRDNYQELWVAKKDELRERLAMELPQIDPQTLLREAQQKVSELEVSLGTTKRLLDGLRVKSRQASTNAVETQITTSEWNNFRTMLDQVNRRVEDLKFSSEASNSRIALINKIRANPSPVNAKRNRYLAMVPVAVLALVLGLFTLLELKGARVGSPDELSARVPVEVFAVPPLPVVRPARGLRGPKTSDVQFELFVQQLDHLRVALCGEASQGTGRGRCVLITSAAGGEGKTTLAAQLAVRCAEAGATTVLIDADLRRATLGRLFEVPECPGLSDVLRGEAKLEDSLVPISQVGGCQLLPAGSPESNPNRILRGQRFAPMLEQLRRTFDVIIIDTSPVLPVPDALIMGRYADGVVLAARHDRSRFPLVERANKLLTDTGIPVLGVVINGVNPSGMRYGEYAYTYRSERPASDDVARGRVG